MRRYPEANLARLFTVTCPVAELAKLLESPAVRLHAELLFDAVALVLGWRRSFDRRPGSIEEARVWIERGNVGAVTFHECCDVLAIDAEHLREAVLARLRLGRAA